MLWASSRALAGPTEQSLLCSIRAAFSNMTALPPTLQLLKGLDDVPPGSQGVTGAEQITVHSLTSIPIPPHVPTTLAGPTRQPEHERALALIFMLRRGYKGRIFFLKDKPKGVS